ncbi:MAG: tripartite tricarboxylate transporter substrate binding protein [Betaproteobacteria bacterium]
MTQDLRLWLKGLLIGLAWPALVWAQSYPDKPITLIVPFPPGIVDANARLVASKASAILGQPIVVRNMAGAGQRIGTDALAKAPKDGYTLGVVTNAGVVAGPALAARMPYDAQRDFSYLVLALESHYLINAAANSGIKSLTQLVDMAKSAPEKLRFGSTGIGTGFHVATELFIKTAGVKMLHVPYKGESPLLQDLIGGQVEMAFSSLASRSMAEAGRLTMLAYTGEARSPLLPQVPTAKELGVAHVSSGWLGFAAPAGLPAAVRERLILAFSQAARDPEIMAKLTKDGIEPRALAGDAFDARVRREIEELRELNKELKLSLE